MIFAVCTFAVLLNQPQDLPQAKDLLSAMLSKYYSAKSVRGHIKLTVAASTGSATVDTDLQLERPGKLYLHQVEHAGQKAQQWLVTADGTQFTYDPPSGTTFTSDSRLWEREGGEAVAKDLKDVYGASVRSIGDRCMPIEVAIARKFDLEHFRLQLATMKTVEATTLDGKSAFVVGGDWKDYGDGPVLGKYQIIVSQTGELYRYIISQVIRVPGANLPPQQILSSWDVNLVVDGPVEPSLFSVIK